MATIKAGKITFTEAASQGQFGYVKGTCKWAELLQVGMYGTFGIKLYGDNVVELETELAAMQDSAFKEVEEVGKKAIKADLYKEEEDGTKFLAFKLKETKYDGTLNKISFFDAGGAAVPDWNKLVGNGSTVKVKYRVAPYYMASTKMVGLSFSFYAVQVIDLKEFSGGGDSGFGDETDSQEPFDAAADNNEDF